MRKQRNSRGVEVRHGRTCPARDGGRCKCEPSYRGRVWNPEGGAKGRWINGPFFPTAAQAENWRQDTRVALRRGTMRPPTSTTVADAAAALVAGMMDGSILDRSGKPYKPSTVRSYRQAIEQYIEPRLGHKKLSQVKRADVQDFVDALRATGVSPSTVHNKLDPLRVIFRRAIRRDEIAVDPTDNLDLPSVRGKRDRIESPEAAFDLIDALPEGERALWSVFLLAGVRRGEARALRCNDFNIREKTVSIERAWDDVEGEIDVKSDAGRRTIPLAGRVRKEVAAHLLRTGRSGDDLIFGRTAELPFIPTTVRARALKAWKAAGLEPLTPHEARHCAISYFIACGYDWKQASVWAGHGDVRQTWNRYGKVVPGDEERAAAKLDSYLERTSDGTV